MRLAAKRDKNERPIIDAWEALGAYVESVSGPGLVDTLVHHKGHLFRAEVKGAKRGLTPKQVENFTKAYEAGVFTYIVRTTEHAGWLLQDAMVNSRRSLLVWTPELGALAGTARKERPYRPGTDKARTVEELCVRAGCGRSRSPGLGECVPHSAEEFAPDRVKLADPVLFPGPMIHTISVEEARERYPETPRPFRRRKP